MKNQQNENKFTIHPSNKLNSIRKLIKANTHDSNKTSTTIKQGKNWEGDNVKKNVKISLALSANEWMNERALTQE